MTREIGAPGASVLSFYGGRAAGKADGSGGTSTGTFACLITLPGDQLGAATRIQGLARREAEQRKRIGQELSVTGTLDPEGGQFIHIRVEGNPRLSDIISDLGRKMEQAWLREKTQPKEE